MSSARTSASMRLYALKARLVLVPDGFHMPFVYKPKEIADTILSFLAQTKEPNPMFNQIVP